jgi:Domain of unknown function (DUF4157)
VHSGASAEQSAQDVNATAYTVGHNIVFGAGRFAPGTHEGARLIAHELTHVIQQQAAMPVETRGSGVSDSRNVQPSAMSAMALQRQVKDPRKLQVVSIDTPKHVRVSEWLVESVPGGGSQRTELYWVDFEVDAKGVIRASIRTVSPDRAYRSGELRYGDEFRRALEHFEESGVEVTAFEGDWSYMTEDEISENLKVFREGLAQGWTREKAAQGTPTGKVLAASGFEVTHVENVPESQPHLAEVGVRRWRVKAIFRRPPLAPVTPPSGGRSRAVTMSRVGSIMGSIALSIGGAALEGLSQYLIARSVADFEEEVLKQQWTALQPDIQRAVEHAEPDIEKALQETNYRKTIYANIHMDVLNGVALRKLSPGAE